MKDSLPEIGVHVSRETTDKLGQFAALVRKWSPKINLVAKSTLPDLEQRHILDSAQLHPLIPEKTTKIADFGSGGGFPGIVLAILLEETHPDTTITLVESDQRKSTFLRQSIRELGLNAAVFSERIENLPPLKAQVITARALASLNDLLTHAQPHLANDGKLLFPKGRSAQEELAVARQNWSFDAEQVPSRTSPDAVIFCLRGLARV